MAIVTRLISFTLLGTVFGCAATKPAASAAPKMPEQSTFATPDAAVDAFVAAARIDSRDSLKQILGPDSDPVLHSGDPVADRNDFGKFLQSYDQGHKMVSNDDGSMTLIIGKNEWPFPFPLVRQDGKWLFDTARGIDEVINRRVGRNEIATIRVCRAIVDAQHDYAKLNPEGTGAFAQKFFSEADHKNGLYWETEPGQPASPLGELVAAAAEEGYSPGAAGGPRPYYGYFYRILTAQGPEAPGGARNYLADDKMTGGFAIVAWPAEYGQTGVMTFLVGENGIVYQQDLGEQTAAASKTLTAYDPDPKWDVAKE